MTVDCQVRSSRPRLSTISITTTVGKSSLYYNSLRTKIVLELTKWNTGESTSQTRLESQSSCPNSLPSRTFPVQHFGQSTTPYKWRWSDNPSHTSTLANETSVTTSSTTLMTAWTGGAPNRPTIPTSQSGRGKERDDRVPHHVFCP